MADIPGLIEGAADGAGLGFRFLKHLSRTRLLLHLIDVMPVDGSDPVANVESIVQELEKFSPTLAKKERWLVLNKVDLVDEEILSTVKDALRKKLNWQNDIHQISALNKEGYADLCQALMKSIERHRQRLQDDEAYYEELQALESAMAFEIRRSIEQSKQSRQVDESVFDEDWD
jgi:GTP-binding protein